MRWLTFSALLLILLNAERTPSFSAEPEKRTTPLSPQERWDGAYRRGRSAPWDIGRPSTDLKQAVENGTLHPCRAVELGCGSGNDAIFLASRGFDVTAIDIAPTALSLAKKKAQDAGVKVKLPAASCGASDYLSQSSSWISRGSF
jgi:2-polyprenyl-3-methyl-5-hydroxy-6-metoxy-1,4-benzoquinol methylase